MNIESSHNIEEDIRDRDVSIAFERLLKTRKDQDDLLADLKEMINHQIDLTEKVEARRIQLNQFALQGLAFSVAATGLLLAIANGNFTPLLRGMIVFLIIYATTAFLTSALYELQSSFHYPFLGLPKYTNKWKWFYYGNPYVQELSFSVWNLIIKRPKYIILENDKFIKSLLYIVGSYTNETKESAIVDAIQQFHLLQTHNCYKNGFYLQLTRIRKMGIPIAFALFLFFLILY